MDSSLEVPELPLILELARLVEKLNYQSRVYAILFPLKTEKELWVRIPSQVEYLVQ